METQTEPTDGVPSFRNQLTDTASRFPIWISVCVLSTVCMFSMVFQRHLWTGSWGWAVAVTIMSMLCSIVGYMGYLKARGVFMGQLPELYLAGFVLLLWITGLPVIMNPSNNIAVGINEIVDANIYFASWGAFICSMLLCGNIAREIQGFDVLGRVSPIAKTRMGKWYMLVFASVVVLIASVRAFIAESCADPIMDAAPICNQTILAISAGVVGTGFSAGITGFAFKKGPLRLMHEWTAALVMVIIFSFALAYVTTADGPGSSPGNLYFSTWASFILSIMIFADCHTESLANRENAEIAAAASDDGANDLEFQDSHESDVTDL